MIVDLKKHMGNKLSIVTPVFEPDYYLSKRCVNSVMAQTNKEFNWLISFDGHKARAKFESFDFYEGLAKDERVKFLVAKKHGGVSVTRNRALDTVSTGFVGFLDIDNWISNEYVDVMRYMISQLSSEEEKVIMIVKQAVLQRPSHYRDTMHYAFGCRPARPLHPMELADGPRIDLGQIVHNCLNVRFDPSLTRLVDYDYMISMMFNGKVDNQYTVESILSYYDHFNRSERINTSIPLRINLKKINDKWKPTYEKLVKEYAAKYAGIQTQQNGLVEATAADFKDLKS